MAQTRRLEAEIVEEYAKRQPKSDAEYEEWVAEVAFRYEIDAKKVKSTIEGQKLLFLAQNRIHALSYAQQVAEVVGANLEKSVRTLLDALDATKKKPVLDKSGIPVLDLDGKVLYAETEDWPSRINAATKLIMVHGGFAPAELKIDERKTIVHLSDDEVLKRLDTLNDNLARLRANQSIAAGGRGVTARGDGPAGAERSLLLVDGVYQDQRRAGSGALQTVSSETISSAIARSAGKRTNRVYRKKQNHDGVVVGVGVGGAPSVHPPGDAGGVSEPGRGQGGS